MEYDKHLSLHSLDKRKYPFKDYRNSPEGRDTQVVIYGVIQKIIDTFHVVGKAFLKIDIEQMLSVDSLDFSDKGIESLCKDNTFVLVTNDRDFACSDIDILSGNPSLLKPISE